MDQRLELLVKCCVACQATTPNHQGPNPLRMTPLPDGPWQNISMDFSGPYPTGEHVLVVIDEFSRFPVCEVIRSTASTTVIPVLLKIFGIFGLPNSVKTDNGPPFNGAAFHHFLENLNIRHIRITPMWPQANGLVERFMRTLKKTVHTSHVEGREWRDALQTFLLNYRNAPHSSTQVAPAKLMFGREVRLKLPTYPPNITQNEYIDVKVNDAKAKEKMKNYSDNRRHSVEHQFKIGDKVLVKQNAKNKVTPRYRPDVYSITKICGTTITARKGEQFIRRNSSFFKIIPTIN